MSLKDKSNNNKKIAYMLLEENMYDASVNRFYYYFFQKLLNYAEENFDYKDDGKGSSHNNLINFIDIEINKAMLDSSNGMSLIRAKSMKGQFISMKKLRVKSDYYQDMISEREILEVQDTIKKLDEHFGLIKSEM
ncbi:hypothetical protein [Staphylococcus shinii]|uniref:hypothetical protein n=1 Tax=Staphylococcus shinii TaxID=2912228 RepID=UPI003CE77ABE